MRAGGARALPPNLASYTKLDELLDALEPNLVAFAGGVSVVSAKDAVTALNNIKRLQYQARFPVQQVAPLILYLAHLNVLPGEREMVIEGN